jgi:UDP-N-acetylglucosamine 2-epimerase (non-hydrolysing)
MLDQALAAFDIVPDYDLNLMRPGQTLGALTARILAALDDVLQAEQPDMVIVQGDTTSTLAGALAAFYHRLPIGHVEAGLRTFDLAQPFPEEMNRVVATRLADLHFAPTPRAAANLRAEGVAAERIAVTGNTGIDAVLYVRDALEAGRLSPGEWPGPANGRRRIVVTSHRRENFGTGMERALQALARIAARDDVEMVFSVHRNPRVLEPVHRILGHCRNIHLIEPLAYIPFVDLMREAAFLITDSGGIQEEAPSLGKPVLVLRQKTERPEAVEAGTVKLVGTDEERIVAEALRLLDDAEEYARRTRVHNPYGDGHASERIAAAISAFLSRRNEPQAG